ncbi:nicalin-1 isoform X2 [Babesia caballi]|uniref:Nicalin-1 isoform X2 n=1 Tax=Babesia caballi TaxID=5871 RepID=A0AAV4M110_BABCB|nr:nicalin-1 isoform X2 [Babesia caballi]
MMRGALCTLLLFFATAPLHIEGSSELEVHGLGGVKYSDSHFGFPYPIYYGRLVSIRALHPGLAAKSPGMSDADLEASLLKCMHKNGYTLMFPLNDILKNRFDFFTFRSLLKTSGSVAIILIPPPSHILPGSPNGCTESPMLELDSGDQATVCEHDPSFFHQSTMDKFHDLLVSCNSKALVSVVEESEDSLDVLREYGLGEQVEFAINRYRVTNPSYSQVSGYKSFNIYGTLKTAEDDDKDRDAVFHSDDAKGENADHADSKPKIVISSHLDTFSLLQSYRTAATNNAGLIAVLELVRLFNGLDHHGYELIALLTTGAILNFQGASTFANSYTRIDSVELILSLDDLTGPDLYVHTSSKPTAFSSMFQQHLSSRVKETIKRGVNTKSNVLFFQHEQFTRQKVHSITVTSVKDAAHLPFRQRSFEYKCDSSVLAKHIVSIAQALAETLHCGPLDLNESEIRARIEEWETKLSYPRCSLTWDLHQDEGVRSVVKYLRALLCDIATQKVNSKVAGFGFYANAPMNMTFYVNRTIAYHVYLMLASVVYIVAMWSIIRASPKAALRDIADMVYGGSPRPGPAAA